MTPEEVKRQAEISARDVIRELQESLDHGFMTFPSLSEYLNHD